MLIMCRHRLAPTNRPAIHCFLVITHICTPCSGRLGQCAHPTRSVDPYATHTCSPTHTRASIAHTAVPASLTAGRPLVQPICGQPLAAILTSRPNIFKNLGRQFCCQPIFWHVCTNGYNLNVSYALTIFSFTVELAHRLS
jgi:hypothetical protein